MSKIMISELQEATSAPDSSFIAIDDGTTTKKITVANYNTNANATAKQYAEQAQSYAETATTAANNANASKTETETLVGTASDYANAASTSASAAAGSASEASGYVGAAQTSASNALASARAAETSAANVEGYVNQAKSWAQGNTGVRAGENTNNAKYWANVAMAAAGGGVATFNGRTGAVVPEDGDYSSDMIPHINSDLSETTAGTALNEAQTNIAEAQGDINNLAIDKLNNYTSDSTQWDAAPTANSTKPVTSAGILEAITEAINSIPKSYVGMIIHSTKFDTEAKVKAFYGGTTWIQHSGYVLRGATSGVVANSATKTGGSDDAVVVKHDHSGTFTLDGTYISNVSSNAYAGSGLNVLTAGNSTARSGFNVASKGKSGTNKNIPNYKSVYIWERTA